VKNVEEKCYEEIWEMVVTELTEQGIREQREQNPEIKSLIEDQTALSAQAQKCLAALDSEVRDTLTRYYEQAELIADKQIQYLYLQGAKDCVRLLKTLGVI